MKIKFFLFFIFIFTKVESQQTIIVSASNPLVKKLNFLELPASVIANESVNITSVVSEKIKSIFFKRESL